MSVLAHRLVGVTISDNSAVKPTSGQEGVNIITLGNVPPTHTLRTLAHMLVAVILIRKFARLRLHERTGS